MIAQYKEKIEMIKMETSVEYQGNETLENLNNAFNADNQKYWVNKAEIENEIIKLTTNDGYLFWITKSSTEYKGTVDVENNSISAESVGYTPDNSLNWTGVTNVKQALDYLYNN